MRVTVVHNPMAGADAVTAADLCAALCAAGHAPVYYSTLDAGALRGVQEAGDVLLAAGGDGTVGRTALSVLARHAAIAVLPLGTANNVAGSLGMPARLDDVIALLTSGRRVPFDVGVARDGNGEHRFIEGAGFGLFPEAMAVVQRHAPAEIARQSGAPAVLDRDLRLLRALLPLQRPSKCRITIDGLVEEHDLLLVEVVNICSIGPKLLLAPDADPGDGLLDIVIAGDDHRSECHAYLEDRLGGGAGARAPRLLVRRGRRIHVEWPSLIGHIDDRRWPHGDVRAAAAREETAALVVEFTIEPGAVSFIVP